MPVKPGIYAASMSVFNENLSLDIDSTIRHSEKLIAEGCHGVAIFGSTGQGQLISLSEKKKLIERLKNNQLKDHFLIGTGSNSLSENIGIMKHSINQGMNRFLLMPPAYYKYGDEEVYSFFSNIIKHINEGEIILYNFEKLSGYKFSIEIIKKLVKNFPKQIVGIKDSTYNLYEKIKIPNFLIFPGSETKLLKGLEIGCSGIISAICNVTATLARKVYDDFKNNKEQNFNKKLCDVRTVFDSYNLISALHSFSSTENEKFKKVLPPLRLLTKIQYNELMDKLKVLEFSPDRNKAA